MDLLNDILNSSLQPYYKRYPAGEYLFRQGDEATTMYFLVNGRLQLINEREGDSVESVLESGQFLGEKVLLQPAPFKRVLGALCETDILVLELTQNDITDIEDNAPGVMTDLMRTVLQVVGGRFEHAGFLAQALRPSDEVARVVNVIRYFARSAKFSLDGDDRFPLSEEAILKYVDTDRKVVRTAIKRLIDDGILSKSDGRYVVNDEEALLAFAEAL